MTDAGMRTPERPSSLRRASFTILPNSALEVTGRQLKKSPLIMGFADFMKGGPASYAHTASTPTA
jgi:hypothetical protein